MHMSARIVILLLVGILSSALSVQAQQGQVTGTVTDAESAEPIQAAQVYIEGTSFGTLTDSIGRFILNNAPIGAQVLVIQHIGHATEFLDITVSAGQPVVLEIALAMDVMALDELVVVGYGTQIRREVTGAVASVRGADIAEASVTPNIQTALQGRLEDIHGSLHGLGCSHELGQEILPLLPELTRLANPQHEPALDRIEWLHALCQRLLGQFDGGTVVAIEHSLPHTVEKLVLLSHGSLAGKSSTFRVADDASRRE